ncbi:MAG: putative Ig domain-containing protein [Candidatus Doudnabacteria bacterium]|nr:putative Ig domain-containing protein [Candidatus Doudnabacteria bacterium]
MSAIKLLVLFFCALACAAFGQVVPSVNVGEGWFVENHSVTYDLRQYFAGSDGKPLVDGASLCAASGVPAGLELNSSTCALSGRPVKAGPFSLLVNLTARNGESATLRLLGRVRQAVPRVIPDFVYMGTYPIRVGEVKPGEIVSLVSNEGPFTERLTTEYFLPAGVQLADGVNISISGVQAILRYISPYRVAFEAPLSLEVGKDVVIEVRSSRGTTRVTVPVRQ